MRVLAVVAIISFALSSVSTCFAQRDYPKSGYRSSIDPEEHSAKRKKQLEALLEEASAKIADHSSGRSLLSDEDMAKTEEHMRMIEQKLERLMEDDGEDKLHKKRARKKHTEL